jgi:hypothetical protein
MRNQLITERENSKPCEALALHSPTTLSRHRAAALLAEYDSLTKGTGAAGCDGEASPGA